MKTLKVRLDEEWPDIDTHLVVDDIDGDGIFNISITSSNDEFLNIYGLNSVHFRLFKEDNKLFYQFNNEKPIDTFMSLQPDGTVMLRFDSKIPGNNYSFVGLTGHRVKIFAE